MPIPGFTVEEQGDQLPSTSEVAREQVGPAAGDVDSKIDQAIEKLGRGLAAKNNLSKVLKASAKIADQMGDADVYESAEVLRGAKRAAHKIYDREKHKWIFYPDHKTRLAAVTLELAYTEGLPVQRSISISGSFQDAGELITTLSESPAAREALKILSTLGIKVEAGGEIIDLEPNNEIDGELPNSENSDA